MKKLLMMIGAAAAVAVGANAATVTIDGVTWTYQAGSVLADGTTAATLGGGSSACIATSTAVDAANIPWTFTDNGTDYTVTTIAAYAFKGCSELSGTLTIPDHVTGTIGNYAFSNCTKLTKIASFGGVTAIGDRSFEKCSGLQDSECPDMTKIESIDVYNMLPFSGNLYLSALSSGRGIGDSAFFGASITNVVLSRLAPNISGNRIFMSCANLQSVYLPGPDTGSSMMQIRRSNTFAGCTSLKVFLAGPLTCLSDTYGRTDVNMFENVSGCRMFVPTGSNWDTESDTEKGLAAYEANNTIFYYGAGRELDMSFDNDRKLVTATPATAHALTNVLAAATTIKNVFGMDTRINVTNAIEIAAGSISAAELAGVTFDSLTFAVKTQAQLDTVLAAVPVETPLAIDPEGATENLTVLTENRKIYVMLPTNGTYKVRPGGFIIIVE